MEHSRKGAVLLVAGALGGVLVARVGTDYGADLVQQPGGRGRETVQAATNAGRSGSLQSRPPARTSLLAARQAIVAPVGYEMLTAEDERTGKVISYDPKYRIDVTDAQSGTVVLRWSDERGQERTLRFQRPDAIDLIVEASVQQFESGEYEYTYQLRNLPSSGQFLSDFTVQTLGRNTYAVRPPGVYVGTKSGTAEEFSNGMWFSFGIPYFGRDVTPGTQASVKVRSLSPPGLVECRARGGDFVMYGDAEAFPVQFEKSWPTYAMWPKGHTIGPVCNVEVLPVTSRRDYVRGLADEFVRLGWATPAARDWIMSSALDAASLRSEGYRLLIADQQITSEVESLLRCLLEDSRRGGSGSQDRNSRYSR